MAITLTFKVFDGGKVALKWAGNNGAATVYRTASYDSTYAEKTDWTAEETLGALITTGTLTDADPLEANCYYVTDGTDWAYAVVEPGNYTPVIQPDYEPVPLNKMPTADAYRNALNNSGATKFDPLALPTGSVAIVAIHSARGADLTEPTIGQLLEPVGFKFNILQFGFARPASAIGEGYEAILSGSTQIKYVKSVS